MTTPYILGSKSAQQPTGKTCSATDGERAVYVYEGTNDEISALYATALKSMGSVYEGVSYQPQKGSSPATLTLTGIADGSKAALATAVTTYELIPQEVLVPVHLHSAFNALTAADCADCYNRAEDTTVTTTPAGWSTAKAGLYSLLLQRTMQVAEVSYVLRRTKLCNSIGSTAASYTNVGKVDAPPSPGGLLGSLPSGEWLKKAPAVRQIGMLPWQNRWQVVDEWQWAKKWSTILYAGTGTP